MAGPIPAELRWRAFQPIGPEFSRSESTTGVERWRELKAKVEKEEDDDEDIGRIKKRRCRLSGQNGVAGEAFPKQLAAISN